MMFWPKIRSTRVLIFFFLSEPGRLLISDIFSGIHFLSYLHHRCIYTIDWPP